ncbi:MAG: hypothetical protein Aurels2KO_32320 [Aureliella sp.]
MDSLKMDESSQELTEVEQQLQDACDRAAQHTEAGRYKSALRAFSDLRDRAKRDQHAYFYLIGVFYMMDSAQYLLDFQQMRERAIELIALLESEERCRQIQPDMPMPMYEGMVYQFSSCAYENLAEATGQLLGYNSEGLQECISDGLGICRQTGKTDCIGCFREYSCDVHIAADDAQLAEYQCKQVLEESRFSDRGNRRWISKNRLATLACLDGRTDEAIKLAREAIELTAQENVNFPLRSKLRAKLALDTILLSAGQPPESADDEGLKQFTADGECPMFELMVDQNQALSLTMSGQFDAASEVLRRWDQDLQQRTATNLWFETRLRLIANCQLAGDDKSADRLAKQLEKRASKAGDWLTVRRLTALQDEDFPTTAIAAYGRLRAASPDAEPQHEEVIDDIAKFELPTDTPLFETVEEIGNLFSAIIQSGEVDSLPSVQEKILELTANKVESEYDAFRLLHLASFSLVNGTNAQEIWRWANELGTRFGDHSTTLSLLADIGNRIRFGGEDEFAKSITSERIEPLVRKSLQLKNCGPRSYLRAGDHFDAEGDLGEAERCYARGFRLDRKSGELALRLARIYRDTERPRDALHVLDLCLREGTEDPGVAWEAGVLAFTLEKYEVMHTYLEQFESQAGQQPWAKYYHAVGFYHQEKYDDALSAVTSEQELLGEPAMHLDLLLASILLRQGNMEDATVLIDKCLAKPLYEVKHITPPGLVDLLERLRIAMLDCHHPARHQLSSRILRAGLAAESYFEISGEAPDDSSEPSFNFYRCLVRQPLDEAWQENPDRLEHQEGWDGYMAEWGVLAADDAQARRCVLDWQEQCYSLPSEVEIIELSGEGFAGPARVVWQGLRFDAAEFSPPDEEGDFDGEQD